MNKNSYVYRKTSENNQIGCTYDKSNKTYKIVYIADLQNDRVLLPKKQLVFNIGKKIFEGDTLYFIDFNILTHTIYDVGHSINDAILSLADSINFCYNNYVVNKDNDKMTEDAIEFAKVLTDCFFENK